MPPRCQSASRGARPHVRRIRPFVRAHRSGRRREGKKPGTSASRTSGLLRLADLTDLYSNNYELPFTPVELRKLAVHGDRNEGLSSAALHRPHELSRRLGVIKVSELVARAQAGESVRSIARDIGVANSALTRMLREEGVEISKRKVNDAEAATLRAEYEAGKTMTELERRHGLSHGAVFRALHRSSG